GRASSRSRRGGRSLWSKRRGRRSSPRRGASSSSRRRKERWSRSPRNGRLSLLPARPPLSNFFEKRFSPPRSAGRPFPLKSRSRRPREALSLLLSRGMKVSSQIRLKRAARISRVIRAIRDMNAPSFMDLALKAAETAGKSGEVPIGCVIVRGNEVIATAGNRTLTDRDPTAHAEILAIREAAAKLGSERLVDCDLY